MAEENPVPGESHEEVKVYAERLKGVDYKDFIREYARRVNAESYLEIGTDSGDSLEQVECDAVCVDPSFRFRGNPAGKRKRTLLFQMTSDDFFGRYDLKDIFPQGVDLAFLDGLHHWEVLLRDFINTEKFCHIDSTILLHDCLPLNIRMAERVFRIDESEDQSTRGAWTGDV